MPLKLLLPFLEGSVRLVVEQAHNAAVVRSLRRSENLQIREDLVKSKQRYAVSERVLPPLLLLLLLLFLCHAESYACTCSAGHEALTLERCPNHLAVARI